MSPKKSAEVISLANSLVQKAECISRIICPSMYTLAFTGSVYNQLNIVCIYACINYINYCRNSQQWLQTDRKVLDHDLPRKNDPILLYFAVR